MSLVRMQWNGVTPLGQKDWHDPSRMCHDVRLILQHKPKQSHVFWTSKYTHSKSLLMLAEHSDASYLRIDASVNGMHELGASIPYTAFPLRLNYTRYVLSCVGLLFSSANLTLRGW